MYDARFLNAKNIKGELYRDPTSGSLINYCNHFWMIYPEYECNTEYHSNFIPEECNRFSKFIGICRICGEVIFINRDNIFSSEEKFEEEIDKLLKEK